MEESTRSIVLVPQKRLREDIPEEIIPVIRESKRMKLDD